MTEIEIKEAMRQQGKADALALREASPDMTGTELIAEERKIPPFDPQKDYSGWPVGAPVTDGGQVWTLLTHNANNYVGRPSTLRALWSLAHTKDPKKAKQWVASYGVSGLYMVDECCTYPAADGTTHVFRNLYDNNEFPPPLTLNVEDRWEDLGEVGTV